MSTLREAAQQALESIDWLRHHLTQHHGCLHMSPTASGIPAWLNKNEAALRAALAQQEEPSQEPVATLIAQRDALLEALIKCRDRFFPADQPERDRDELWEPVTAAIKAAEGEKK